MVCWFCLSITNLSRGKRVITEFTVHFASISFPLTPTSAFCIRKRSRILARNFNAFLSNNNIFLLLFFFFPLDTMRIKKHLSIDEWKRTHRNYLEEYATDLSNHVCRIIGRIIDWNINIDSMKLFALYRRVRTVILLFSWQPIIKLYRSSRACREIASRIGLEFLCSSYC